MTDMTDIYIYILLYIYNYIYKYFNAVNGHIRVSTLIIINLLINYNDLLN